MAENAWKLSAADTSSITYLFDTDSFKQNDATLIPQNYMLGVEKLEE